MKTVNLKLVNEILSIVIIGLAIFLVVQSSMQHFQVEGPSMEPSLNDGEHLLVNRTVYFHVNRGWASHIIPFLKWRGDAGYIFHAPNRGDIVVFQAPGDEQRDYIKRIIAVPGDTVEIKHGKVIVNGRTLNESYIAEAPSSDMPPQLIPPDRYFVLGDNRNRSSDSRAWGTVPHDDIVGKAWVEVWPPKKWGLAPNHTLNIAMALIAVCGLAASLRSPWSRRRSDWLM